MSDLPEARQMPHGIDNVVGRLTFRLVYDKRSVDRRQLWLSWHKSVVSFQFLVRGEIELYFEFSQRAGALWHAIPCNLFNLTFKVSLFFTEY